MAFILTACGNPKDGSAITGTYLADYDIAKETLTVNPDGTFVQEVELKTTGKKDTTKGLWTYDSGTGYITFKDNFMSVLDGFRKLNPDYVHPKPGLVIQPVSNYFGTTYIGTDEGVLYKRKQKEGSPLNISPFVWFPAFFCILESKRGVTS